jgi:hypothetical protein
MKKQLLHIVTAVTLFSIPSVNFGQTPNLGVAADFVIFTTTGAVGNTGISQITGNMGTNSGSVTGFGNVNGVVGSNAQCAVDLLTAYNKIDSMKATLFPAPSLGGGQIIFAGVDSIGAAATLDQDLILDAQGISTAVFIFKIQGPLSSTANAKVKLKNGALACNVFWKVEGLVDLAPGTTMRGTIIANNAAINMNAGDTLEGRALSTSGAVSVDGVLAYTPTGCGSATLYGPISPTLATTECYAIFSSSGMVTNSGVTTVTGDIGTNVGLTTGYSSVTVTGMIHPIPDASTAQCATDLGAVYTYLSTLPNDIELMFPAQFGGSLVLTPHVYIMNAAAVLTDTLYLDARNVTNAVFVIKTFGAFSTTVNSKVKLINGTQSKNVYWTVDGAVSITDNSVFKGTIIANNGAVSLNTGVILDGRALSTTGTFTTTAINAVMPTTCSTAGIGSFANTNTTEMVTIYPNPFTSSAVICANNMSLLNKTEVKLYDVLGSEVIKTTITEKLTTLETNNLSSGIYFYKVICNNKIIQSGKLISNNN